MGWEEEEAERNGAYGGGLLEKIQKQPPNPTQGAGCGGCGGKGGILYKKLLCTGLTVGMSVGLLQQGKHSSRYPGAQNPRATIGGTLSNK